MGMSVALCVDSARHSEDCHWNVHPKDAFVMVTSADFQDNMIKYSMAAILWCNSQITIQECRLEMAFSINSSSIVSTRIDTKLYRWTSQQTKTILCLHLEKVPAETSLFHRWLCHP